MSLKIGRRSDGDHPHRRSDRHSDHILGDYLADSNASVESLRDDIDEAVVRDDLDLDFRVLGQQLPPGVKHWHGATATTGKIFHLRRDPFERADGNSNTYYDWLFDHVFPLVPCQTDVAKILETLEQYPPRQKPASFNLDRVMERLTEGGLAAH